MANRRTTADPLAGSEDAGASRPLWARSFWSRPWWSSASWSSRLRSSFGLRLGHLPGRADASHLLTGAACTAPRSEGPPTIRRDAALSGVGLYDALELADRLIDGADRLLRTLAHLRVAGDLAVQACDLILHALALILQVGAQLRELGDQAADLGHRIASHALEALVDHLGCDLAFGAPGVARRRLHDELSELALDIRSRVRGCGLVRRLRRSKDTHGILPRGRSS